MRRTAFAIAALAGITSCGPRPEKPRAAALKLPAARFAVPTRGAPPIRMLAGVDAEAAFAGCDEVHVYAGEGITAEWMDCVRDGHSSAARFVFQGDPEDPSSLPLLRNVAAVPRKDYVVSWTEDPRPVVEKTARRGERGLRELVWNQGGVRFAVLAHAVTVPTTAPDGTVRVPFGLNDYRVVSLEAGPQLDATSADDEPKFTIEPVVGKPSEPASQTYASRVLRSAPTRVRIQSEGGVIHTAEWRFLSRPAPFANASTDALPIPKTVFVVAESEPWERDVVRGFGRTTLRWKADGIDWTVELDVLPVFAYDPQTRTYSWRSPYQWEWRMRRVVQTEVARAAPMEAGARELVWVAAPRELANGDKIAPKAKHRPAPWAAQTWFVSTLHEVPQLAKCHHRAGKAGSSPSLQRGSLPRVANCPNALTREDRENSELGGVQPAQQVQYPMQ